MLDDDPSGSHRRILCGLPTDFDPQLLANLGMCSPFEQRPIGLRVCTYLEMAAILPFATSTVPGRARHNSAYSRATLIYPELDRLTAR